MKFDVSPLKAYMAQVATEVRAVKREHRMIQRTSGSLEGLDSQLGAVRRRARAAAMAYAQLRGTPQDRIETKPTDPVKAASWVAGGDLGLIQIERRRMLATLVGEPRGLRLYVIVSKKLSAAQKAIQTAHAVANYMVKFPGCWANETLIVAEADIRSGWGWERYGDVARFSDPGLGKFISALAFCTNEEVKGLTLAQFGTTQESAAAVA